MKNNIVKVGFHGGEIEAVKQGNDVWVSVRRACEHLGIASNGQVEKLKEKEWAVNKMILSTGPDGKKYQSFMLHLDSVPMWLATIDTNRVHEDVRSLLVAYQKEAAKVLREHFFGTSNSKAKGLSNPKEERLLLREERLSRKAKAEGLKQLVTSMKSSNRYFDDISIITMEIKIAETLTGESYPHLLPTITEDWKSPTQIAALFGKTSNAIGRMISTLGIRGNREYSKKICNKATSSNREVESFMYNARALEMIKGLIVE
jgi:hypothetical protein